jgi:hypothetical protein
MSSRAPPAGAAPALAKNISKNISEDIVDIGAFESTPAKSLLIHSGVAKLIVSAALLGIG